MKNIFKLIFSVAMLVFANCGAVSDATWLVRLKVSGIEGNTVFRLTQGNGTQEDLTFSADDTQTFGSLKNEVSYSISLVSAPEGIVCLIGKEEGEVAISYEDQKGIFINYAELEETIPVFCGSETVPVSATVVGLHDGDSFGINFLGGVDLDENVVENGVNVFEIEFPLGTQYNIAFVNQPLTQFCHVTNGSGTASAAINDIVIECDYVNRLFSAGLKKGDMDGRSGADATCAAIESAALCDDVVAFISVNATDEIRDFPDLYGVKTDLPIYAKVTAEYGNDVQMASDWAELLDEDGIDNELFFSDSVRQLYWTGSKGDGSVDDLTCSEWNSASGAVNGRTGWGVYEDSNGWLNDSDFSNGLECSRSNGLLCLCVMHRFEVGGTVSGLDTDGELILSLNAGEKTITMTADGTYGFWLEPDAVYEVTVSTQPSGQNCTVANEWGIVSASVNDIDVTCVDTTQQTSLFLFPSDEVAGANLGGRSGADTICQNTQLATYSSLTCTHGVSAFLSVNDADEIQDMPTLYDVPTDLEVLNASSADALVANDWDDLLDGEIASSFDFDWWSGSDPAGAILEFGNCSGWTSDVADLAIGGQSAVTDSFWIELSDYTCDASELNVMCLCY